MSHIRSVPSIEAGNAASHAIGLGQMNLHGYLAREGIAYGSPSTRFHQSLFLYHHGTHCVPRCCWRANAVKPSPGSNSHAMPVVNISANICKVTGSRKRRKLANCLPVAVLRYLPVRCGAAARRRDALWHIQPESPGGAANRFYLLYQPCHVSIHPIVAKVEIRKEGKTGRVYYPAPFMTNENLALYQDAYEIGAERSSTPTRKRLAMSIRGCR